MHSCLVRLQNAFGFFTTVAAVVAIAVALTSVWHVQTPSAAVTLQSASIVKGRAHYYSTTKTEYAKVHFDLDADLTSLFAWNTKQVFVWVTARYPSTARNATAATSISEAVIWDRILEAPLAKQPPSLWTLINRNAYDSPPAGGSDGTKKGEREWLRKQKERAAKKAALKGKASPPAAPEYPGVLRLRNEKPKYRIPDPSGHIAHLDNVTLSLGWNVQPWVGALAWTNRHDRLRWKGLQGGESKPFALPGIKATESAAPKKKEKPKAGKAEPVVG